jgi:Acetoacetate decarboxylase (ADC)
MFVPERGKFYRMPVPYGPMPGPRQVPAGKSVDHRRNPKHRTFGVSYLVERARLEALLPPGFSLWGEPVLTVDVTYMWGIDWLAGRGYNTFGVKFPAIARANGETVHGTFLSVLWENLADPIISGREELGFNKLYCEIPEPRAHDGRYSIRCGWLGHAFFDMELSDLRDAPPAPSNPQNAGLLHYKFMPRTGEWGAADFAGAVLSPSHPADITITARKTGTGQFRFTARAGKTCRRSTTSSTRSATSSSSSSAAPISRCPREAPITRTSGSSDRLRVCKAPGTRRRCYRSNNSEPAQ